MLRENKSRIKENSQMFNSNRESFSSKAILFIFPAKQITGFADIKIHEVGNSILY